MITNITELLNNFHNDSSCVIKLNYDELLYAPINDIVDMGELDEEIQNEDTESTYSVHKIQIIYGAENSITIKAYWTSRISYNSQTGKWEISEPM